MFKIFQKVFIIETNNYRIYKDILFFSFFWPMFPCSVIIVGLWCSNTIIEATIPVILELNLAMAKFSFTVLM